MASSPLLRQEKLRQPVQRLPFVIFNLSFLFIFSFAARFFVASLCRDYHHIRKNQEKKILLHSYRHRKLCRFWSKDDEGSETKSLRENMYLMFRTPLANYSKMLCITNITSPEDIGRQRSSDIQNFRLLKCDSPWGWKKVMRTCLQLCSNRLCVSFTFSNSMVINGFQWL